MVLIFNDTEMTRSIFLSQSEKEILLCVMALSKTKFGPGSIDVPFENTPKNKKTECFSIYLFSRCGHCQRLMPTFDKLAAGVNAKEDANVKIGAVDCTKDGELCSEHEVTGYPTLRFFKKNSKESVKFRGTRDLPSLQSFIIEQLGESGENLVDSDSVEVPKPVSALVELTEDTFPKHVATGKHFIKFYAPWCGHCQKLAPTWQDLAKTFEHDKDVSISKIDCTQYRPICTDFEVKGYPTLLWIEDGKKIEKYSGSRAHEDLKAYVDKMSGHPKQAEEKKEPSKDSSSVVLQLTKDDFEHTIEKGVTMAKFYAPWCSHCEYMEYTSGI